jgi:hypothetical protein
MVADPFDNWAAGYAGRIRDSQHVLLDVYIKNYEDKSVEVCTVPRLLMLPPLTSTYVGKQIKTGLP